MFKTKEPYRYYENRKMYVTDLEVDGRTKYMVNYKTGGYHGIYSTLEQAIAMADSMEVFLELYGEKRQLDE